jgi:DNA end-binding protein Ku
MVMAPTRAFGGKRWSLPIALYPASSVSEKVSFNRINRKTGNRLKQQNVDAETGEMVSHPDCQDWATRCPSVIEIL